MLRVNVWLPGALVWSLLLPWVAWATPPETPAEATRPLPAANELVLVVMDPLAFPLSCPCVKGYAQRDYQQLANHLADKLGRKVRVDFGESLKTVTERKTSGRADLVIGKRSVVAYDARALKLALTPIASLTGKDGATTQTGLIVVPTKDPAKTVADLNGYRIIFGPEYCEEKHAAVLTLLKAHGVTPPAKLETSDACSDGALLVLEAGPNVRGAAVISSYARPLLEGCGTIQKGDLRVVGETPPLPFVTAFVNDRLSADDRASILAALSSVGEDARLCKALETKAGFVAIPAAKAATHSASGSPAGGKPAVDKSQAWNGWRGPHRNGLVVSLPEKLTDTKFVWRRPLKMPAQAGVAADELHVLVAERDPADKADVFRCLSATTGEELWSLQYPAAGRLDYGNAPRATPLIHGGLAYLHGAFGHLHAVELETGKIRWRQNLRTEFAVRDKLVWGTTSSPLIVENKLIVNPGATDASLAALHPETGEVLWKTPGEPAAFASFVVAEFSGRRQLIGYDKTSLGGWDLTTGERLWKFTPRAKGDFNVPTPVVCGQQLLLVSENNGARLHGFDANGKLIPTPVGVNDGLAPDSHTPVAIGGRAFGIWGGLHCLDLKRGLQALWIADAPAFDEYATIIGSPERLLITSQDGQLILVDARAGAFRELGRFRVFEDDTGVYSHPALVGQRLYVRGSAEVVCLQLSP